MAVGAPCASASLPVMPGCDHRDEAPAPPSPDDVGSAVRAHVRAVLAKLGAVQPLH